MEKTGFTKIGMLFRLALLVCLSCAMLSAKAQTARVTLDLKEVTLTQAMNEIKKQTRYLFINRDVEDINGRKVSINVSNELISNALNRIFTPLGIDYYIDGKSIIISKRRQSDSKPVQVSGSVTDTNGQPVIGASVIVKGTTLGVSTDAEGMFSLQVPPPLRPLNWKSIIWATSLWWYPWAIALLSILRSKSPQPKSNRSWSLLLVLSVRKKR